MESTDVTTPEVVNPEVVNGTIRAEAATACRQRIEDARRSVSTAFYDMSMGLLEAYENEYAKDWGYENFSEYVEKALDMKYRTAYYMVEIGRTVQKLSLPRERVQAIGWTKLKEVTGALNAHPEESERYLTMAETMSTKELQNALSEAKMTEQKEARPAIMRLSLRFSGDEANIINDGLALAQQDIGSEDVNLSVQHIFSEWLMQHGSETSTTSLEDWIDFLEKRYGVKLVKAEETGSVESVLTEAPVENADEQELNELLNSSADDVSNL